MTKSTRAPRNSKSPKQRAEETLGVSARAVKRLTDKAAGLRADLAEVEHELALAERRHEYLAAHPDLDDSAQMSTDDALDGGE